MALLAAAGHSLTIVTMTPGDCGSADIPADEIADIRRTEAGSAAALIGGAAFPGRCPASSASFRRGTRRWAIAVARTASAGSIQSHRPPAQSAMRSSGAAWIA